MTTAITITIYHGGALVGQSHIDTDGQIMGEWPDDVPIEAINDALDHEPQDDRYTGSGQIGAYTWQIHPSARS